MRIFKTKRSALLAVVGVLAISAAAIAYWTASGTGQGTGSVGSDAGVSITDVTFAGPLYPGGSTTVTYTVNNLSSDATAKVDKVVQDGAVSGLPAGCVAADLSFAPSTVNTEIAKSGSVTKTGTLSMANTNLNQDKCKDAAPVLALKTDNSGI